MTPKQYKELLRSQQGETNAVLMYKRLAQVVKTEREREAFLQLAREEGRHASVFHAYTEDDVRHPAAALSPAGQEVAVSSDCQGRVRRRRGLRTPHCRLPRGRKRQERREAPRRHRLCPARLNGKPLHHGQRIMIAGGMCNIFG